MKFSNKSKKVPVSQWIFAELHIDELVEVKAK